IVRSIHDADRAAAHLALDGEASAEASLAGRFGGVFEHSLPPFYRGYRPLAQRRGARLRVLGGGPGVNASWERLVSPFTSKPTRSRSSAVTSFPPARRTARRSTASSSSSLPGQVCSTRSLSAPASTPSGSRPTRALSRARADKTRARRSSG